MSVIPAKAGIHPRRWTPAFAGVTIWALLLAVFTLASPAAAQTFPQNNGSPVVDQAGILRPEQVADLTAKAQALYAQTGRAFAIATVKSLEGYQVDDYAYRLGRAWGLGEKGKDNGVLLLVAPSEHKVTIATGYGAGAYMTDAMSGIIIREDIVPHFKQSPPDYGGGIETGADAIIKQMSLSPDQAEKNIATAQQAQQRQHSQGSPLPAFFWLMVFGFVALSHFRRGVGRSYRTRSGGISPWVALWALDSLSRGSRWGGGGWGGGGFGGGSGGGFGGFGGGSFGGGGASGSW